MRLSSQTSKDVNCKNNHLRNCTSSAGVQDQQHDHAGDGDALGAGGRAQGHRRRRGLSAGPRVQQRAYWPNRQLQRQSTAVAEEASPFPNPLNQAGYAR